MQYGLREVCLGEEASPLCSQEPSWQEVIMKEHIGQWYIANYDEEAYPGIIQEVEEDVCVKCMHKNGINKFFWLSP